MRNDNIIKKEYNDSYRVDDYNANYEFKNLVKFQMTGIK